MPQNKKPREGSVRGIKVTNGKACLYCQGCGRYMGTALGQTNVRLLCPVCKHEDEYRVAAPRY